MEFNSNVGLLNVNSLWCCPHAFACIPLFINLTVLTAPSKTNLWDRYMACAKLSPGRPHWWVYSSTESWKIHAKRENRHKEPIKMSGLLNLELNCWGVLTCLNGPSRARRATKRNRDMTNLPFCTRTCDYRSLAKTQVITLNIDWSPHHLCPQQNI